MTSSTLAARPCTIWIDRHLHKTAGTTVRNVMERWHGLNQVHHLPGWISKTKPWTEFVRRLAGLTEPACSALPEARFSIELHMLDTLAFESQWMPPLRALRQNPKACCRVLLTTRLRQPLDQYISFYRWAIEGRRSVTFEKWAPSSLQSVELSWGPYKNFYDGNLDKNGKKWFASYGAVEHERAVAMLERDFDLVYPSERFGEGMEAIAKELGLAEWAFNASRMQAVAPKWNTVSGAPSAHRKARSIEDPRLCGNMTACVALVHHIGAWDQILYERAARRFEQQYERVRLTPFVPPSVAPPLVACGCSRCNASGAGCFTRCGVANDREGTGGSWEKTSLPLLQAIQTFRSRAYHKNWRLEWAGGGVDAELRSGSC